MEWALKAQRMDSSDSIVTMVVISWCTIIHKISSSSHCRTRNSSVEWREGERGREREREREREKERERERCMYILAILSISRCMFWFTNVTHIVMARMRCSTLHAMFCWRKWIEDMQNFYTCSYMYLHRSMQKKCWLCKIYIHQVVSSTSNCSSF